VSDSRWRAAGHLLAPAQSLLSAFLKAFAQLPDPTFRIALVHSFVLSALVLALLAAAAWWTIDSLGLLGGWPAWILGKLGLFGDVVVWLLLGALTWMLFPAVATLFVSFYLERVVGAVEAHHYASDAPASGLSFGRSLIISVRFTVLAIGLNLAVLPIYLILFWFTPINLFIFYGLNGYILSREYFDLVALRYHDEDIVRRLRQAHWWRVMAAGLVITFMLTVPLLNLLAPILGAAAMVHLYKSLAVPVAA